MKRCASVLVLIAAASAFAPALAKPIRPPSCDRACLQSVADQYMKALAGHSPAALPHDRRAKFTENNVALPLGEASWRTVSQAGPGRILVLDPEQGAVGLIAPIEEGGRPALMAARLVVRDGKVHELETVVGRRESTSFLKPEGALVAADLVQSELPRAERTSAPKMIGLATAYFQALSGRTGDPVFADDCNRVENGVQTTNVAGAPSALNTDYSRLGCDAQLKAGALTFISRVRDVRYAVVDESRGLVFAIGVFDHNGLARAAGPGGKLSASLPSPYSFIVAELFKIRSGRIEHIDAVMSSLPYGSPPAW